MVLSQIPGGKWAEAEDLAGMANFLINGVTIPVRRCHWVKPVMVCQIKFTEWTRDDRLRQPIFLGIGQDKNPEEVVRAKAS